jgi:hypothetical protein
MKNSNRFYVYVHLYASGEKAGTPFYVGKGSGTRAYSNSSRNKHWHAINNKYGRVVKFHMINLDSEQSCIEEIRLISEIGIENLANKSKGGDKGALGFTHTEDWKLKNSEFMKIEMTRRMSMPNYKHPCLGRRLDEQSKERISESLKESRKKMTSDRKRDIANKIKNSLNTPESIKKRSEINSGENNPMYDSRVFIFRHDDGSFFTGTQHQLIKAKSIPQGNVSSMVRGNRNSVAGWRIIENVVS